MKQKKRVIVKVICAELLLMVLLMFGLNLSGISGNNHQVKAKWQVQFRNQFYETSELNQLKFLDIKQGDRILLSTTLKDESLVHPTLTFYFQRAIIHVYFDGEEVYSYGEEYKNQTVGSGYVHVNLPTDLKGKALQLEFILQEEGAVFYLPEFYLQESERIWKSLICDNFLLLLITVFLFGVGIIGIIIVCAIYRKEKQVKTLFWICCFAMTISLWLLCYSKLIQLFIKDYHRIHIMEYMTLYLSPLMLLLFLRGLLKDTGYEKYIRWLVYVFASFDLVMFGLNFTGIFRFPQSLKLFWVLAVCCGVAISVIGLRWAYGMHETAYITFAYGIITFMLFMLVDVMRYMLDHYVFLSWDMSRTCMSIGILTFVLMMTVSLALDMLKQMQENVERQTLISIAYTDALTNINNRARCEEEFRVYDQNHQPVTIINMDLNLFKEVNDTYGHAAGDELLIRFACLLENSFQEYGFVGRMGGDEFIVIMEYHPQEEIKQYISEFLQRIDNANATADRPYTISVSYGWADNYNEPELNIWKVYEKADKSMYQFKNKNRRNGGHES